MQVKIVRSFVDQIAGQKYKMEEGQVVDLPDGANWLDVHFAVPVRGQVMETMTVEPEERAVKPASKKRAARKKAVDKVMRTRG